MLTSWMRSHRNLLEMHTLEETVKPFVSSLHSLERNIERTVGPLVTPSGHQFTASSGNELLEVKLLEANSGRVGGEEEGGGGGDTLAPDDLAQLQAAEQMLAAAQQLTRQQQELAAQQRALLPPGVEGVTEGRDGSEDPGAPAVEGLGTIVFPTHSSLSKCPDGMTNHRCAAAPAQSARSIMTGWPDAAQRQGPPRLAARRRTPAPPPPRARGQAPPPPPPPPLPWRQQPAAVARLWRSGLADTDPLGRGVWWAAGMPLRLWR